MSDEPNITAGANGPAKPEQPKPEQPKPEPQAPENELEDLVPEPEQPPAPEQAPPGAAPPSPGAAPPKASPPFGAALIEDAPGCTATVLGLPLKTWDTVAIILLAIAADVCLYTYPGGTGAAVLLLVAGVGLVSLAPSTGRAPSGLMLLTVLLIAIASAWNLSWGLGVAAFLAATALAIRLHRPDWTITEVGWALPWTVVLAPAKFLGHLLRSLGCAREPGAEEPEPKRGVRIPVRVVLVPLCVIVVFVLIFRAASPVVEQLTKEFFDWIAEWLRSLWDMLSVARIFTWLFWLIVFAALVRPLVKSYVADALAKRRESLEPPETPAPDNANYATAAATLISVNILFIAFHAIDWPYLYRNFEGVLPAGISYSEFSHRGCIWLTIGLLLSTAIIGVIFRKRLNFHPGANLLRGLAYVWAALNGVLALGALRRLQMYVDYNGLTAKRIVGIYGILLVVAGLILMVIKVRRSKNFTWLVRRDLVALWVTIILIVLTPVDYLSWTYNARQALRGNSRPLANLLVQRMSPESFPPLIPLLDYYELPEDAPRDTLKPEEVRKGIAGLLGRKLVELRASKPKNWTQWQGAHTWALRALEAVEEKLNTTAPPFEWEAAESKLKASVSSWIHTRRRGPLGYE